MGRNIHLATWRETMEFTSNEMRYTSHSPFVNPVNYSVTDMVKLDTYNEKEYDQNIAMLEAYIAKLDREIADVEKRIESRRPKDKWHELAIQKYIETGDMSGVSDYERYMNDAALRKSEKAEREAKEQEYKEISKQDKIDELVTQYNETVNLAFAAKKQYESTKSAADEAEYKNFLTRAKSIVKKLDDLGAEYELQKLPDAVKQQGGPDEISEGPKGDSFDEIATNIKNLFADERFIDDAARQEAVNKAEELLKELPDSFDGKVELRNLIDKHKKRKSKKAVQTGQEQAAAEKAKLKTMSAAERRRYLKQE